MHGSEGAAAQQCAVATRHRCSNAAVLPDERWFGLLTDKLIRRGVHTSVPALEKDIRAWVQTWNENPRPFTWTKTADEILNSLADYLAKITPPTTKT